MPLQGDLKDFPLEQIITLLNEGAKSGVLEIEYKDKENNVSHKISVFFKKGNVVYATDGIKTGVSVMESIAKLFEGSFIFVTGDVSIQNDDFNKITFEEFKQKLKNIIEKWRPLKMAFPSLNEVVYLSSNDSERLDLNKNEWSIIALVGKGTSIKSLINKLNSDEFSTLETLFSLKNKGIIKVQEVEKVSPEIAKYIPHKARSILGRHGEIEDAVAKNIFSIIDGRKTLVEIANEIGITVSEAEKKIKYLVSLNRVVSP